jgi:hypothetical protein
LIDHQQIEKQLISRLRKLGFILLVFSVVAFGASFIPEAEEELAINTEDISPDFEEPPPLNMYLIAIIFASVGGTCLTIAWKKKNSSPIT